MNEGFPETPATPEKTWPGKDQGLPPPMTTEFGYAESIPSPQESKLPPPLPDSNFNFSKVPPLPEQSWPGKDQGLPPPLPESNFDFSKVPPLPSQSPVGKSFEKTSEMQERSIEEARLLDQKEASKKLLAEERKKLAEEFRIARKQSRDKLAILSVRTDLEAMISVEGEKGIERMISSYEELSRVRTGEANNIAGRLEAGKLMSEEEASEEGKNIEQLINSDEKLRALKEKLELHYAQASLLGKEKFERIQRSVEQTALRNGVFFIHTIQEQEQHRHNELSNISQEAKYEDDADILLSLEPTISASTIFSGRTEEGKVSGIWSDTGGFLVGGGDVRFASKDDLASRSVGIKEREIPKGYEDQSIDDIDEAARKRGEQTVIENRATGRYEQGSVYNEFIVENPKVFGYFQPAEPDENGQYWARGIQTRNTANEIQRLKKYDRWGELDRISEKFKKDIQQYKDRFDSMQSKGLPLFIMTPDREVYECLGMSDNGALQIGKQLTPEEVATGRAGLSQDKRKEIGSEVIEKRLFRDEKSQTEAAQIIETLS